MQIEKHNSHGMQLLVNLKPLEALALAAKLIQTAQKSVEKNVNHYFSTPCAFEDDNDRLVKTDLDFVVETGNPADCQPTYPCGKEIVQGGMNSAPESCNMQENHEHGCYRR
jgi:hypothetical protein